MPNVFQMNVANIMPGDEVKVELSYTELLVPTDKVYEFVTRRCWPRLLEPAIRNNFPSSRWMQNPYLHQAEVPTYTYDITVDCCRAAD